MKDSSFVGKVSLEHKKEDYLEGFEYLKNYLRPLKINRIKEIVDKLGIPYTTIDQEVKLISSVDKKGKFFENLPSTEVTICVSKRQNKNLVKREILTCDINRYFPTNYCTYIKVVL